MEEIKQTIMEIAEDVIPNVDLKSSDKLVTNKIMDSLSIVTLVQELSIEFDVKFDLKTLKPENLDSLDAMAKTIKKLMG